MASIYIGNLNPLTTEDELRQLFSIHGKVSSIKIVKDPVTGKSKGYGFIEIEDSDVDTIINEMNGVEFGGQNLKVNHAVERKRDKPAGKGFRPRTGFNRRDNDKDENTHRARWV